MRKPIDTSRKPKYGAGTIAFLTMLDEATQRDEPFQAATDVAAYAVNKLVARDLIMKSEGIDGTVKYKITGRGQELLRSNSYYRVAEHAVKSSRCETCIHRQVLDQVRERCVDVEALAVAMEALVNVKSQFNGGTVQANMETIRAMNLHVEAVEEILGRLK
jgi:hypothetical protein